MKRVAKVGVGAVGTAAAWVVAAALIGRGLPAGVVAIGVVLGAINALPALGVALLYRTTGIVNLAQGQLGTVGVLAAMAVRTRWDQPWVVAAAAGVVVAAAVGAIAHVTVFRRLRDVPVTVAVIATVGVAELTGGFSRLAGPELAKRGDPAFTGPISARWSLYPTVLTGDHLLAAVALVVIGAALTLALARSRWGRAVRAVTANRSRASGIGLPVDALLASVWAIAAALAAVALLLQTPIFRLAGPEAVIGGGSALLLRALAAAAVGRMQLLATALAAVGLGVVEQTATWATGDASIADLVLVAAIIGALLLRRGDEPVTPRSDVDGRGMAAPEPQAVPAWFRFGGWVAAGVGIAFALVASPAQLVGGGVVLVYAIVAVSVVIVSGWAGQLSLGQFAVAGLGGAVTSVLFGRHGLDITVALAAGAAVGALVMVVVSLPARRRQIALLPLTTLALAVAAQSYLLQQRHVAWLVETDLSPPVLWGRISLRSDRAMYLACLAGLVLAVTVASRLGLHRFGRVTIAGRDNPAATAMVGINSAAVRLRACAVAGALAGFGGGLYVVHESGLRPEAFTPAASISVVAMAAIGGLGSVPGAVAGAVVIRGIDLLLPAAWSAVVSGTGILVFLLWFPSGIGGLLDAAARRVGRRELGTSDAEVAVAVPPLQTVAS